MPQRTKNRAREISNKLSPMKNTDLPRINCTYSSKFSQICASRSSKPWGVIPNTEQIFSIQARVPSGPMGNGAPMSLHLRRRIKVVAVRLRKGFTPAT